MPHGVPHDKTVEFMQRVRRMNRQRDTLHLLVFVLLQQAKSRADLDTARLIESTLDRLNEGDPVKLELLGLLERANSMTSFNDILKESAERRERDAKRFAEMDTDLCMLCHAYGDDKRGLFIRCGYAVYEAVAEALDVTNVPAFEPIKGGYFLNICKHCRAELLIHMHTWADDMRRRRDVPKDHDGSDDSDYDAALIPVRMNGVTVMLTESQFEEYQRRAASGDSERFGVGYP